MKGLLADVNVQGHIGYVSYLLDALGLWDVLRELDLRVATFPELGLDRRLEDRPLWEFCQNDGWVLFTDNRNAESIHSLQSTIDELWRIGCLPILTLSSKRRFEDHRDYAERVASDVATVLFGIAQEQRYRDQPRIYVPLSWP